MSEELYQRCPVCKGSTWLNVDNSPAPGTDSPNFDPKKSARGCPCRKSKTSGWCPIGLTVGQVERMVDLERTLQGDEGIPQPKRAAILAVVRARLGLLTDRGYFKTGKGEADAEGPEGLGADAGGAAPGG